SPASNSRLTRAFSSGCGSRSTISTRKPLARSNAGIRAYNGSYIGPPTSRARTMRLRLTSRLARRRGLRRQRPRGAGGPQQIEPGDRARAEGEEHKDGRGFDEGFVHEQVRAFGAGLRRSGGWNRDDIESQEKRQSAPATDLGEQAENQRQSNED